MTLAATGLGLVVAVRAVARQRRFLPLEGRTALITGGSRGLGLVLARELARRGARLAICARDAEELHRAELDLQTGGADVLAITCDVTDQEQVERAVDRATEALGSIDIVINNAGTIQVGPLEGMTARDYEVALRTHFWGPLYVTLAALPGMRQRGTGRIVNISSIGGKISTPHLVPYSASKFALTGLSEGLRAELAKDNIFVTTVIPGLMRTGSPPNAFFKGQHRAEYAWFSISDAIPGLSTSAESAARRIVTACQYGDPEVILTLPAQFAVPFHGLFPGLTSDVLGLVNRLLPGPGGAGTENVPGHASTSVLSPSWLTWLSDQAAMRNNEVAEKQREGHARGAVGGG